MRKTAIVFGLLVFLFGVGGARVTDAATLLVDYVGYDYEFPNPDSTLFGEAGSGYKEVGNVPNLFAPLVPDTVNYEYTYYISGLTQSNRTVVGDFVIVDYSGPGTFEVFEDSKTTGTDPVFGVYPPNGTAPGSFTDGTLFLEGAISSFQVVFSTTSNSGSYNAQFDVTGGSQYGNIPANQRMGWSFAGITGNELNKPAGYQHQVDGQIFLNEPVPTKQTSWGKLKSIYR